MINSKSHCYSLVTARWQVFVQFTKTISYCWDTNVFKSPQVALVVWLDSTRLADFNPVLIQHRWWLNLKNDRLCRCLPTTHKRFKAVVPGRYYNLRCIDFQLKRGNRKITFGKSDFRPWCDDLVNSFERKSCGWKLRRFAMTSSQSSSSSLLSSSTLFSSLLFSAFRVLCSELLAELLRRDGRRRRTTNGGTGDDDSSTDGQASRTTPAGDHFCLAPLSLSQDLSSPDRRLSFDIDCEATDAGDATDDVAGDGVRRCLCAWGRSVRRESASWIGILRREDLGRHCRYSSTGSGGGGAGGGGAVGLNTDLNLPDVLPRRKKASHRLTSFSRKSMLGYFDGVESCFCCCCRCPDVSVAESELLLPSFVACPLLPELPELAVLYPSTAASSMLVNLEAAFLRNMLTLSLLFLTGVAPSQGEPPSSCCSGVRRPRKNALTSLTSEMVAGTWAAVRSLPPPPPLPSSMK